MDKRPGEELRAGLAGVADIPGIAVLSTPAWDPDRLRWIMHCRITADVDPQGPIPPVTDWFVLIGEDYPHGRIGIYPAKAGGITRTFPHQDYNGEGKADSPWRSGKLCTWTNAAPLHRRGYDSEPAEPELNLAWHLRRAQAWLELASAGELTQPGDPYELPYVPHGNGMSIAFCEGSSTLRSWLPRGKRCGIARGKMREAEPPILAVTRFESGKDRPPVEQEWGRGVVGADAQDSAWIRLEGVPVLPPYQIPMTWGELREACRIQGVGLDALLRPAVGRLASGSPVLLIGFPIPARVGGPDSRMHWLALQLPEKTPRPRAGFRNTEEGRWLAYRTAALADHQPLYWLETANWHREEISVRGQLGEVIARSRLLIIGAGAIGSVLSELLARAGVRDIAVLDPDRLEAGNLVRHTLLSSNIGRSKAISLGDRLTDATVHGHVSAAFGGFPPIDEEQAEMVRDSGIIIDTTGEDAVPAQMDAFEWRGVRTFISVSLGIHARRLFFFAARDTSFPQREFVERLQPWLQLERNEYDLEDLPRDGPGCWHPRHPARIDDVWMMTAAAVKLIEQVVESPPGFPYFTVLEQDRTDDGTFTGIRQATQPATP